jgi:SWI/SNF-related matrix-associated actin-dependent regulator 1 of chromatin subfamily A
MNFILSDQFGDAIESLQDVFKLKGKPYSSLLSEDYVLRAKKLMTPFMLQRTKDQVSSFSTCIYNECARTVPLGG